MKRILCSIKICLLVAVITTLSVAARAQTLTITREITVLGNTKPIPVALEGFSGEVESVLKFDLYVQGFGFVSQDAAQYIITGSNNGGVVGRVTDKFAKATLVSRSYTGASLRSQAHAFANDVVQAITGKPGISLLRGTVAKIAFKSQSSSGNGEIYVADFDGNNAQALTHDDTIVAAPAWVPGHLALYYNSYKLNNPDIFYHNLSTGQRKAIAHYSGSNISPAVSPDGTRVAMVLSKGGSPDIYVSDPDGENLRQLTHTAEDESSPCWSPDGQWICFATKIHERRCLAKISVNGGELIRIPTSGAPNPTEPDWSPDGKFIAFTSQTGEFDICVVPANGGTPVVLVPGQDPSWAPNSRTLVYNHSMGYRQVVSVLDVFTKQYKDVGRISGSNSEAAWAK